MIGMLNGLYRGDPALHQGDADASGFFWIDGSNSRESVLVFGRQGHEEKDSVVVALNFTPVPRENHRIGVPRAGKYREVFNSDAKEYGGSGYGNLGGVEAKPIPSHGRRNSIVVGLPPLAAVFFTAR
jgi:1,4-alpha-glucan branching enzyme